jgi:hypothetical protein
VTSTASANGMISSNTNKSRNIAKQEKTKSKLIFWLLKIKQKF